MSAANSSRASETRKIDGVPISEQLLIAREYTAGIGWFNLARRFRRGTETVKAVLAAHGVTLRTAGEAVRRYAVDDKAFDRGDRDASYWLGFVLADGHVLIDGGSGAVILALAVADIDHVRAFREFLRCEHPLKVKAPGKSALVPRSGPKAAVEVWSHPLAVSIAAKGVGPGKSSAGVPPGMGDDADFWRGVVDGDGWLQFSRFKYRPGQGAGWYINLGVCGTKAVCEGFASFAERRVGRRTDGGGYKTVPAGSIWKVNLNGYQALRMADLLYSDAPVSLARKKATADAFAALASNL